MAGGTKEQVIRVVMETAQAEQTARTFDNNERKRTQGRADAESKAAADTSKAHADAYAAMAKEAKTNAKIRADADKIASDSAKDAAREVARENAAAARESAKAARDSAREQAAAARDSAREATQAARDRARDEKAARDEVAKSDRDFVRAKKQEANALAALAKEHERSQTGVNDAIMGGVKSAAMFGAAMVGVSSAGQVLNAVLERFELLRTRALEESGKMTAEATDLRRLSALEGNLGRPSLTQASQLKLRAGTLQTAGEAAQMTTAAKASAFGAISAGRVTNSEFDKFLVSQGKLQTLTGSDARAVGNAAGLMPMITGKEKNSAKDLENLSGRLYEIQKLGGFEDYGQASEQLGQSAGYVMKGIYSAPEVQALQSAFAMGGEGGTASERLTQLTRATSANMMRNRKMNLGADYQENSATSYQYFKKLGINDQTAPMERAMKVVADVQQAEDAAKKAGKEFYGTDYLAKQGFNSVQDREAILKLVGVSRTGLLGQLVDKAKAPIGESTEVKKAWKEMNADPVFQKRASDLQTEAANKGFGVGEGGIKTFENQMLERAYANTGGLEGNAGYDLKDIKDRWRMDPRNLPGMKGSMANLRNEAQRMVLENAKSAGVETPELGPYRYGEKQRALEWGDLQAIDQRTRAAGGTSALGDNGDKLEKAMNRLTDNLEKLVGKKDGGVDVRSRQGRVLHLPPPALDGIRQAGGM